MDTYFGFKILHQTEIDKKMRTRIFLLAAIFATGAMAQTVHSPNGNIELAFSLDNGKPTYQLTYKGKAVVNPSHLGLELAKDKHASKGMDETDLIDGFVVTKTSTSTLIGECYNLITTTI